MRSPFLLAALAGVGLAGPAAAQYYAPYAPPYRYRAGFTPYPYRYAPQYVHPSTGYNQYVPPYSAGLPAGGDAVTYIRSLYLRVLGREPDPQGVQTWLERLGQYNGDTNRLTQEFIQAAQRELNSNNPAYPPGGGYPYP